MTYAEMQEEFEQDNHWVIERLQGPIPPRTYGPFPTQDAAEDFYETLAEGLRNDGAHFLLSVVSESRKIWS